MNDPNARYLNNYSALLNMTENKSHMVSPYSQQSPSVRMKPKSGKESSTIDRPKSNKLRYVGSKIATPSCELTPNLTLLVIST